PGLPTLLFGYRLYEVHGDSTSTVRIPAGDTFVVPAPVDSVTNVGRVGTEFTALGTAFFAQQEYRRVDRSHDLAPAGPRPGADPPNASTLTFFSADRDDHLDIPSTTVRVRRPLGDVAELTGAYLYSHAELDFSGPQRSVGTTDAGTPVAGTRVDTGGASL